MTGAGLRYDQHYAVELYDRVQFDLDGNTFEGVVKAVHPRRAELKVRYDDWLDIARTTGEPRAKTRRVPVAEVQLIARDG